MLKIVLQDSYIVLCFSFKKGAAKKLALYTYEC